MVVTVVGSGALGELVAVDGLDMLDGLGGLGAPGTPGTPGTGGAGGVPWVAGIAGVASGGGILGVLDGLDGLDALDVVDVVDRAPLNAVGGMFVPRGTAARLDVLETAVVFPFATVPIFVASLYSGILRIILIKSPTNSGVFFSTSHFKN